MNNIYRITAFINNNGISGGLRIIFFLFLTKLVFSRARLIRFPIRVRGKKFMTVNKGFTTGFNCRLDAFPEVSKKQKCIIIGENVQINDNVHIASVNYVEIGNNVLIASKVFISDHDHGSYGGNKKHDSPESIPKQRKLSYDRVIIEDNVWIGQNVVVLKGVTIGSGSIIGANSLVNKNIPKNSIVVGNPSRIIKKYSYKSKKWEKT